MVEYREKHPHLKGNQAISPGSAAWRALSEEARSVYEALSRRVKEDFDKRARPGRQAGGVEEALSAVGMSEEEVLAAIAGRPIGKDPELPKRPLTAYNCFMRDFSAANPDLKGFKASKPGGKAWAALPRAQRVPYEERNRQLKEEYAQAMKDYVSSGKQAAWEEAETERLMREYIDQEQARLDRKIHDDWAAFLKERRKYHVPYWKHLGLEEDPRKKTDTHWAELTDPVLIEFFATPGTGFSRCTRKAAWRNRGWKKQQRRD